MRSRAERRANTDKKLEKRMNMLKSLGEQQGLVYEKHREKIHNSSGYMRDGNVSHYVKCKNRKRTKNSSKRGTPSSLSYGSRHNYSSHDIKQINKGGDTMVKRGTLLLEILKKIANMPDYKVYRFKGVQNYGFVITPSDNILTVYAADFGGVRATLNYVPSKSNGSGCSCSDVEAYTVSDFDIEALEKSGLEFAFKLGARKYKNSKAWLDREKQFHKDSLYRYYPKKSN